MLQLHASEFPPPLSQRGSPQRTRRNSSAEKSRKMFARKNPAAGERIRARLQRAGKKFCFFSAVGETRASAPSAFIPHPGPPSLLTSGGWVGPAISQNLPKIFRIFKNFPKLQNLPPFKDWPSKAVLPLFPMLFSPKSGTPNTPRNQTPSLICGNAQHFKSYIKTNFSEKYIDKNFCKNFC